MSEVRFPEGFRLERLQRAHARKAFHCGQEKVDDWLASKALRQQNKNLSITKVLLNPEREIAGYYTLATGQVDFSDLPKEITKRLPRRALPVVVLAWLGVNTAYQRRGLGQRLLAQALQDCHEAGQIFPFIAVILDCLDDNAKAFYKKWGFEELPGYPYRLFLSASQLRRMMQSD